MLCKKCREQIEVGEACVPVQNGTHTAFYHIGCHTAEVKDQEDKKRTLAHYEEQAALARTVC